MTATLETDTAMHAMIARSEIAMRHTFKATANDILAPAFAILTDQERHILLLVSEGESNATIAQKMFLSPGTVRNYVSSILMKLQFPNRAAAAAYAVKFDLEKFMKGK